ncbi:hypothetical protein B0H14DRAFT_3431828 [Mycena olivaceomarginata]|nr:hypothetical protein B0H14DRAFT_3431828 [Mycena olivaceomarginata]
MDVTPASTLTTPVYLVPTRCFLLTVLAPSCLLPPEESFALSPTRLFWIFSFTSSSNILKRKNSSQSIHNWLPTPKPPEDESNPVLARKRLCAMEAASKPVAPKPLASKVKIYKEGELDIPAMVTSSRIRLGKTPHEFQKRFFANVMQGSDVILDIGTGSGKSLYFDLQVL